ncbi:hypothetical protein [Janibacter corallicola]|uniref:hypothetical protein n=1 Tax=Janibacter corallicola TaxID=415212 RepID=UPI0008308761|nr:hypothetical protein [Janibacter corallicola]
MASCTSRAIRSRSACRTTSSPSCSALSRWDSPFASLRASSRRRPPMPAKATTQRTVMTTGIHHASASPVPGVPGEAKSSCHKDSSWVCPRVSRQVATKVAAVTSGVTSATVRQAHARQTCMRPTSGRSGSTGSASVATEAATVTCQGHR